MHYSQIGAKAEFLPLVAQCWRLRATKEVRGVETNPGDEAQREGFAMAHSEAARTVATAAGR